jgi:IclR family KDG regulon transcriptional repressor
MKINSVDKAVTILNCFNADNPVLGVSDISQSAGFTISTVSRILSTLESRGVVEKAEGYGKYQLGYRTYIWGIISQQRNNLATLAKPIMEKLRDICGEEVSLYVLSDSERVCLARVASRHAIAMVGPLGGNFPLHAGASGRVLLAFLSSEKRKEILADTRLQKFTPYTITDLKKLEENLIEIRKKGYGISKEEREPGAYSVVAPIRGADGEVEASLCIAGPLYRLGDEQEEIYIKYVLEAAEEISVKIGYSAKTK